MRTLLVFLLGVLVGANVVYFAMTHWRDTRTTAAAPVQPAAAPPSLAKKTPAARATPQPPATPARASTPAGPAPSPTPAATAATPPPVPAGATLSMPLPAVKPEQLVDTFDDLRGGDRRHEALDIHAPAGTPVLAVADGHVEKLFTSVAGGLTIYQFDPTGRYAYYYAHLQGYAPGLAERQSVKRGQVLGYVGSTGNANPAAPHLHFAVFELGPEKRWWQGTAIDPYPLLGGRPRTAAR